MGVVYELEKKVLATENGQLWFWKGKSFLGFLEMDRKAPINSKRPNFR